METEIQAVPVDNLFNGFIRKGYQAMGHGMQIELKTFIRSAQHGNGCFTDRAGKPDLYYSLFGVWLSRALEMGDVLEKHKRFIHEDTTQKVNPVDSLAFLIISRLLYADEAGVPSLAELMKLSFFKNRQAGFFYRLFLFMLAVDMYYPKRWWLMLMRPLLAVYPLPDEAPCSIVAAYTVVRSRLRLGNSKEIERLVSYFEEGKGFKAFTGLGQADLLSTSVALFALKTTGADLRLYAPSCLELIQDSYDCGAFLAGNGDNFRDLEYTFYGLLALGILV